jgi:hypothetical protein
MTNWINSNKKSIIRSAFLVPILSVAVISISHVVSWYDLANPISWAIYLSVAIEIAAMSSIAASSVKIKGFSVWFVFIIVTLIQFIGNIYYCFSEIDAASTQFKNWVDLTQPILEAMGSDLTDTLAQRRWLALLEGGLLPLISLTCLHFFIKYGDIDDSPEIPQENKENDDLPEPTGNPVNPQITDSVTVSQIDPEPIEFIQEPEIVEPSPSNLDELDEPQSSSEKSEILEKTSSKKNKAIPQTSRHKQVIKNLMKFGGKY